MHHIQILFRARHQRTSCDDGPNYAPALFKLVRIPVPVHDLGASEDIQVQ